MPILRRWCEDDERPRTTPADWARLGSAWVRGPRRDVQRPRRAVWPARRLAEEPASLLSTGAKLKQSDATVAAATLTELGVTSIMAMALKVRTRHG